MLVRYKYDASGAPIGMRYRNDTYAKDVWDIYWFDKNFQGDILGVYNSAGTRLVSYSYDLWGKVYISYSSGGASTSAAKNSLMYRGYYYDKDLGLYYLISRYYDANTGRFISADGIMSGTNGSLCGFNLYVYCFNNPIMYDDSCGNWPSWNDVGNWFADKWNDIKKTTSILFTEEFANNIDDIIVSNVEADAGVSLEFAIEYEGSVGKIEFSQRMDIVRVQFKDGKIRFGHDGRAALALGVSGFSFGPQNDTFESFIGDKDNPTETFFDIGLSVGQSSSFYVGYHYNASISFLGIYNDIAAYVKERWD